MQRADPWHSTPTFDPEYTLASNLLRVSGSLLGLLSVFSTLSGVVIGLSESSPLELPSVPSTNCHSLLPSGILCQVRSSSLLSTSEGVLSLIPPVASTSTRLSTMFDNNPSLSIITYVLPASTIASDGSLIVADPDEVLISKLPMFISAADGLNSSIHSLPSSSWPGGLSSISFIITVGVDVIMRDGGEMIVLLLLPSILRLLFSSL